MWGLLCALDVIFCSVTLISPVATSKKHLTYASIMQRLLNEITQTLKNNQPPIIILRRTQFFAIRVAEALSYQLCFTVDEVTSWDFPFIVAPYSADFYFSASADCVNREFASRNELEDGRAKLTSLV